MSNPTRICLLGGSGLVGGAVIRAAIARPDLRVVAVARRELDLPPGARMEVLLADPADWRDAIAAARPDVVVSALGTAIRRVDGDHSALRAVDHDLVLACANWAIETGARHLIAVSAIGADPHARDPYLRTKGETEVALGRLDFARLDLIRPGPLRGARRAWRSGQAMAHWLAPVLPLVLHGNRRRHRPIAAQTVAEAILALARQKARGRFIHDYDGILRALRRHELERSIRQASAVE